MVALLVIGLAVGSFFITKAYFFKDQDNKGEVTFAPGIYLEFDPKTVLIDENNPQNWKLLYYANKKLDSAPVEFNTKHESAYPGKTYLLESPAFKSGTNANGEAAAFVARAKLEYQDQNGNLISQDVLDKIFSQDFTEVEIASGYAGKPLEFEESWVLGNKGYYYYVGDNQLNKEPETVFDLKKIEYSKYAPYIKVLKTENDGYAYFRLANLALEN